MGISNRSAFPPQVPHDHKVFPFHSESRWPVGGIGLVLFPSWAYYAVYCERRICKCALSMGMKQIEFSCEEEKTTIGSVKRGKSKRINVHQRSNGITLHAAVTKRPTSVSEGKNRYLVPYQRRYRSRRQIDGRTGKASRGSLRVANGGSRMETDAMPDGRYGRLMVHRP